MSESDLKALSERLQALELRLRRVESLHVSFIGFDEN